MLDIFVNMPSSSRQTTTIVASTVVAIGSLLLLHQRQVANKKKPELVDIQSPTDATNIDSVAYIRIRTSDIVKSVKFYTDLGLVHEGTSEEESVGDERYVVLKCPMQLHGQPYLLIEYDPTREVRTATASDVGYARICFLVKDVHFTDKLMKNLGYEPCSPPITDRPGSPNEKTGKNNNTPVTIVAYKDYDGNMVELVSLTGMMQAAILTFNKLGLSDYPAWVHVNINTTSFGKSYEAYNRGFGLITDVDYGRVVNTLYQALNISSPGIAKQVQLIKFPKRKFCVDLIQWEDPITTSKVKGLGNSLDMAITVKDVAFKIDELVISGNWSLTSAPKVVDLPKPWGKSIQASVSDQDGTEINLVSFGNNLFDETLIKSVGGGASIQPSKNKVVLVTGCDSGFGRSAACQLAGLGFTVVAACYTTAGAQFINGVAKTVIADLTTEEGLTAVLDEVITDVTGDDDKKELWGIVNNAGMAHPGNVMWTSPEMYKKVMALNFHAPVRIIHDLLPLLKESKGRIVNITSVCGIVSAPSNSTYSSSKFALEALSDALRVELAPFGCSVIVLEPTTMKTPLAMSWSHQWKYNYDKADPSRISAYPAEWAAEYHRTVTDVLDKVGEDPYLVVKEIINALVLPVHKARILCGEGAKAYRMLQMMPDNKRDTSLKDPNGHKLGVKQA